MVIFKTCCTCLQARIDKQASGEDGFIVANDGHGGTQINVDDPVCYLRGTHILIPSGERCVEDLKIGDAVVTRFGGLRAIKWIGRQSFAAEAIRGNLEQIPVHIRAGALGENLPVRDLYVSPGHSMLIGEVLVLAKSLVNGLTVKQEWIPEKAEYYQLELDRHDCVIAEGNGRSGTHFRCSSCRSPPLLVRPPTERCRSIDRFLWNGAVDFPSVPTALTIAFSTPRSAAPATVSFFRFR
jgi:hypothetical protein